MTRKQQKAEEQRALDIVRLVDDLASVLNALSDSQLGFVGDRLRVLSQAPDSRMAKAKLQAALEPAAPILATRAAAYQRFRRRLLGQAGSGAFGAAP